MLPARIERLPVTELLASSRSARSAPVSGVAVEGVEVAVVRGEVEVACYLGLGAGGHGAGGARAGESEGVLEGEGEEEERRRKNKLEGMERERNGVVRNKEQSVHKETHLQRHQPPSPVTRHPNKTVLLLSTLNPPCPCTCRPPSSSFPRRY